MAVASVNTSYVTNNRDQDTRNVINTIGSTLSSASGMVQKGKSTGDSIGDLVTLAAPLAGPSAPIVAGIGALIKAIF
jgi:hypothetical protein